MGRTLASGVRPLCGITALVNDREDHDRHRDRSDPEKHRIGIASQERTANLAVDDREAQRHGASRLQHKLQIVEESATVPELTVFISRTLDLCERAAANDQLAD